jgi:hypothetical protein
MGRKRDERRAGEGVVVSRVFPEKKSQEFFVLGSKTRAGGGNLREKKKKKEM